MPCLSSFVDLEWKKAEQKGSYVQGKSRATIQSVPLRTPLGVPLRPPLGDSFSKDFHQASPVFAANAYVDSLSSMVLHTKAFTRVA